MICRCLNCGHIGEPWTGKADPGYRYWVPTQEIQSCMKCDSEDLIELTDDPDNETEATARESGDVLPHTPSDLQSIPIPALEVA